MKVLNLYAGIGGNRKLWPATVQATAVELNPKIAAIYEILYPNDKVIVGDAHDYLLNHYDEFDFIWSSPPCPSHSRMRKHISVGVKGSKPIYPDMNLYEEILFLRHYAKCRWVVENVVPYYQPLIAATCIDRHLFWANFVLRVKSFDSAVLRSANVNDLEKHHTISLINIESLDKRKLLRNCVNPKVGLSIFNDLLISLNKNPI